MSALSPIHPHVWTAPSWQGLSSRVQHWSVRPCVRPVFAVHMTAGHNALRGSGPGQNPAFDNALAHVGCPDRRIDRLCITCCSSSQPSHHAGMAGAISFTPQVRQAPCSAREAATRRLRPRTRRRASPPSSLRIADIAFRCLSFPCSCHRSCSCRVSLHVSLSAQVQ